MWWVVWKCFFYKLSWSYEEQKSWILIEWNVSALTLSFTNPDSSLNLLFRFTLTHWYKFKRKTLLQWSPQPASRQADLLVCHRHPRCISSAYHIDEKPLLLFSVQCSVHKLHRRLSLQVSSFLKEDGIPICWEKLSRQLMKRRLLFWVGFHGRVYLKLHQKHEHQVPVLRKKKWRPRYFTFLAYVSFTHFIEPVHLYEWYRLHIMIQTFSFWNNIDLLLVKMTNLL